METVKLYLNNSNLCWLTNVTVSGGPDLVHGAEDMSIVLLEAADTGETSEGS